MGPGQDRTRDPWKFSPTRICSQTRYRLRYAGITEASPTMLALSRARCTDVSLYTLRIKIGTRTSSAHKAPALLNSPQYSNFSFGERTQYPAYYTHKSLGRTRHSPYLRPLGRRCVCCAFHLNPKFQSYFVTIRVFPYLQLSKNK